MSHLSTILGLVLSKLGDLEEGTAVVSHFSQVKLFAICLFVPLLGLPLSDNDLSLRQHVVKIWIILYEAF